jgi:hypothetical protein
MDTKRDLYKQKYEAQLHEWKAKLDVMEAQYEKLTAQAKIDAKPHIDAINAKLKAAKTTLGEVAATTREQWKEVIAGLDHAWAGLKAAANGTCDAPKHNDKP